MQTRFSRSSTKLGIALTCLLSVMSVSAAAADLPLIRAMPESRTPPPTKVAIEFALKVHLPEGKGLARALLDLGVEQEDAAAAAKIAAGHLGDGQGGCDVKVEISQVQGASRYRVERVALATMAENTTIERRNGELTVISTQVARRAARLV